MAHAEGRLTRGAMKGGRDPAKRASRKHGSSRIAASGPRHRTEPALRRRRALPAAVLLLITGAGLAASVWLMVAVMAMPY